MSDLFMPYGNGMHGRIVAKVGNGKQKTPLSLAARMPSAEVAAKVGTGGIGQARIRRVIRRAART